MPARAFSYEKLTVSNAVKVLTPAKYEVASGGLTRRAVEALISLDGTAGTNDLRYTLEGTAPVGGATPTGHLLAAQSTLTLTGEDIAAFKAIRDQSTDVIIHVTYFRE